jgi:hypothetical protein
MPTKKVRTEPALDTPALFATTESPCPEKILPTARVLKLKMPTKIAIEIIESPTLVETVRPAKQMTKDSENNTTSKRKTKRITKKIKDLTGLTPATISWEPFYSGLSQEEFKIVCKNYSQTAAGYGSASRDRSVYCFVCAIHPNCTHVIKRYK